MPAFDAVLFDCDGVLVDSEPITNEVLRRRLADLGWSMSPAESIERFVGRSVIDEIGVIERHTGVRIDDAWIHDFRAERNAGLRAGLEAIPGALEAVAEVSARYGRKIACASGADRAKVDMQLAKTGFAEYFGDRVFSGMDMGKSKPAPDVYLAAADALDVDPVRCAVIEDSVAGIAAGLTAGATVFGFASDGPTHASPDELRDAGVAHVFSQMSELPGLVGVR